MGVLFDSGASGNLIAYETWNSLKQKHNYLVWIQEVK